MVKRNLHIPFRFLCMTDDPRGINPNVEILPLEDEGLEGWWYKVTLFKQQLYHIKEPTLYLDLDVVIKNDIEPFFDLPGEFCIIEDWNSYPERRFWNSSIFRFIPGAHPEVWEDFIKNPDEIIRRLHGDQEWITEKMPNPTLWPKEWCPSFKANCIDRRKRTLLPEPEAAKIVVFHGRPNPPEAISGIIKRYPPCTWVAKYWRE